MREGAIDDVRVLCLPRRVRNIVLSSLTSARRFPVTSNSKLPELTQRDIPHRLVHRHRPALPHHTPPTEPGDASISSQYHLRSATTLAFSRVVSRNNPQPVPRPRLIHPNPDARPRWPVVLGRALYLDKPVAHLGREPAGDVLCAAALWGEGIGEGRALLCVPSGGFCRFEAWCGVEGGMADGWWLSG